MNKIQIMLLILSCILPLEHAGAATISFNQIVSLALVGDSVDVDVVISGLGLDSAPSISTFDLDIGFDDSQLSFASVLFGNQLDTFGLGFNPAFAGVTGLGTLNIFELSFDLASDLRLLQEDSFTIATLTFDVLSAGTGSLDIFINALGDSDGNSLPANVESTSIISTNQVSAVPIPAALWLFLSGFIAIGFTKKKPTIK